MWLSRNLKSTNWDHHVVIEGSKIDKLWQNNSMTLWGHYDIQKSTVSCNQSVLDRLQFFVDNLLVFCLIFHLLHVDTSFFKISSCFAADLARVFIKVLYSLSRQHCGKQFVGMYSYKHHLLSHNFLFRCGTCSKEFRTMITLKYVSWVLFSKKKV